MNEQQPGGGGGGGGDDEAARYATAVSRPVRRAAYHGVVAVHVGVLEGHPTRRQGSGVPRRGSVSQGGEERLRRDSAEPTQKHQLGRILSF